MGPWGKNLWTLLRFRYVGELLAELRVKSWGTELLVEKRVWGHGGLCAFSQSIKLVNAVIAGNLFMWALCGPPLGREKSN